MKPEKENSKSEYRNPNIEIRNKFEIRMAEKLRPSFFGLFSISPF